MNAERDGRASEECGRIIVVNEGSPDRAIQLSP
jgi:hypothetical protein